jgi:hydroxyethylthiazole kinase
LAATFAMAALGVAGEMAAARAVGPGSLQVALLDALAELSPETFERSVRVDGV